MEIIYLDEVDSTQKYLLKNIKEKKLLPNVAVLAKVQNNGIGSRGNRWIGKDGNLFLSFAIKKEDLAKDIPIQSLSIYFSYILKEILEEKGSKIWIKWPNDFYIEDKKIGGVITNMINGVIVCGIGLNIVTTVENFSKLDIEIDINKIIKKYLFKIEQKISWKQIFSKYRLEFQKSKNFMFNMNGERLYLKDAKLCDDGSIKIENQRIYSLR